MKFKFIGKEHTNFNYNDKKFIVKENETVEVKCEEDKEFNEFLIRNKFIEVKMIDTTKKEVKTRKVKGLDITEVN